MKDQPRKHYNVHAGYFPQDDNLIEYINNQTNMTASYRDHCYRKYTYYP